MNIGSAPRAPSILAPAMVLVLFPPLGIDLYLPSLPGLARDFGASVHEGQLTLSVFVFMLGFGQLFIGPVSDAFGRRQTALWSVSLFSLASVAALTVTSLGMLLGARALQGFAASGAIVTAFSLVRDVMDEDDAAKAYSYLNGALNVIPTLAPFLGGLLLLAFDWHASFAVLAILGLLAAVILAARLPETNRTRRTANPGSVVRSYVEILHNGNFLAFAAICSSALIIILTYVSYAPALLIENLGISPFTFSLYFCANAALVMGTSFAAPFAIARLGRLGTIVLGAALIVSGGSALLVLAPVDAPLELMGPVGMASCGFALMLGSATSFALAPFGDRAGTASAMLGGMQMISAALMSALASSLQLDGARVLAGLMICLGALSLAIALRFRA
jgi:MFS transporter, DHA1 family, multidrug resistance protein